MHKEIISKRSKIYCQVASRYYFETLQKELLAQGNLTRTNIQLIGLKLSQMKAENIIEAAKGLKFSLMQLRQATIRRCGLCYVSDECEGCPVKNYMYMVVCFNHINYAQIHKVGHITRKKRFLELYNQWVEDMGILNGNLEKFIRNGGRDE